MHVHYAKNTKKDLFNARSLNRKNTMGEIIYSIVIGACLVVSGIFMNKVLKKEEKMCKEDREDKQNVNKE